MNERFDDVADDLVDLSYHDLLKWLPDNYEWVEQAAENGRNKAAEHEVAKEQGVSLKGEAEAMRSASDALSGEHGTDAPQRDPHAIE